MREEGSEAEAQAQKAKHFKTPVVHQARAVGNEGQSLTRCTLDLPQVKRAPACLPPPRPAPPGSPQAAFLTRA